MAYEKSEVLRGFKEHCRSNKSLFKILDGLDFQERHGKPYILARLAYDPQDKVQLETNFKGYPVVYDYPPDFRFM